MSENQLDKLFRKKLGDIEVIPDDSSWYKLEDQLRQKKENNARFWYGVAAAVVVLLTGALFVFNSLMDSSSQQEVVDNDPQPKADITQPKEQMALNIDPSPDVDKESNENSNGKMKQSVPVVDTEKSIVDNKEEQAYDKDNPDNDNKAVADKMVALNAKALPGKDAEALPELSKITTTLSKKDASATLASSYEELPDIKIVYKSDENDGSAKRGVDKILTLAKEVKNMDIGFGMLREAKNELIARNINKVNNRNLPSDRHEER